MPKLPRFLCPLFSLTELEDLDTARDADTILDRILSARPEVPGASEAVHWMSLHYGMERVHRHACERGRPVLSELRMRHWRLYGQAPVRPWIGVLSWPWSRRVGDVLLDDDGYPGSEEDPELAEASLDLRAALDDDEGLAAIQHDWLDLENLGWTEHEALQRPLAVPDPLPKIGGLWGFRWVLHQRLAGCRTPGRSGSLRHDLKRLRELGVSVLVSLTRSPVPERALSPLGMASIFFPLGEDGVPTVETTAALCLAVAVLLRRGESVAVHSTSELGTGSMLAAYLVWQGTPAAAALLQVRTVEPAWVQTEAQVRFVFALERYRQLVCVGDLQTPASSRPLGRVPLLPPTPPLPRPRQVSGHPS